jgi:glycosyltransferase involved in cell wall biosynthesis
MGPAVVTVLGDRNSTAARIFYQRLRMETYMTRSARLLLPMIRKAIARLPGAAQPQKTIAVDVTPFPLPACSGLDVGAVCSLLRALSEQQSSWHWILLTSPTSHGQFANLDALNVRRHCLTMPEQPPRPVSLEHGSRLLRAWRKVVGLLRLPNLPAVMAADPVLGKLRVDLLFCPFAATHFHDASIPTVAVWNDLTHLHYPQFLRPEERAASDNAFRETLRIADRLVCFSGQTRAEIVNAGQAEERRVSAIRMQPLERLPHAPPAVVAATLKRACLTAGQYLFYPAEFAEANNHKLLLVAFGMFRARHAESNLKLVCTGPANAVARRLQWSAWSMGLGTEVVVLDAPTPEQQAALLQGCRGIVFPCLEGARPAQLFQALEFSKPIVCSDLANLPEAARDAALLFDPKRPAEIVLALEQLAHDPALMNSLTQRSHRQAMSLGGVREVAQHLVAVFQDVLSACQPDCDALAGLHGDGWTGERFTVTCRGAEPARLLRLELQAPDWIPWDSQTVRLLKSRLVAGRSYKLRRGQTLLVERPVPCEGATFEFKVSPALVPQALGLNDDARRLGCICRQCAVAGAAGAVPLYPAAAVPSSTGAVPSCP